MQISTRDHGGPGDPKGPRSCSKVDVARRVRMAQDVAAEVGRLQPGDLRVLHKDVAYKPIADALSKLPATYDGVKPDKKSDAPGMEPPVIKPGVPLLVAPAPDPLTDADRAEKGPPRPHGRPGPRVRRVLPAAAQTRTPGDRQEGGDGRSSPETSCHRVGWRAGGADGPARRRPPALRESGPSASMEGLERTAGTSRPWRFRPS